MTLIAVPEHGLLLRGPEGQASGVDDRGRALLSPRHFAALRRLDDRRGQGDLGAFDWTSDAARARQWVGVLQLPGLSVEILPKIERAGQPQPPHFARRNLLHMLAMAGDVPLRERDLAALATSRAPLSECLIAVFARRLLAELLAGLDRSYTTRRQNAPVLRGKLLFNPHVRLNAAHRERFFVERDELTEDTALNRALKAACRALLGATADAAAEESLRHCLLILGGVSDTPVSGQDLARIALTRRSARFAPLLDLCRLILSGQAPTPSAGPSRSFSLLFDMNVVFERYIGAVIQRHVMGDFPWHTAHVHARHHWRYLLESRGDRDPRGILRLEPDLLICRRGQGQEQVATIDTKWKLLDQRGGRRGASREDLYQLYAYAQRYGCPHNVLLYPRVPEAREEDFVIPAEQAGGQERTICVRFVDLSRDLRAERRALQDELTSTLAPLLAAADPRPVEI